MEDLILITRTTYRVSDFLSWQRQGSLDLRPPFQRGSVWSAKAKSFFIDSIVRGYPVPLMFLQDQTHPKTYEPSRLVIDGQQRLRTALAYIDHKCLKDADETDSFTVLKTHNVELAGKSFRQLDHNIQQRILQFEFSVHVLPPATANSVLLEVFARMNATGTRLNDQELRNAEYSGAFKQLAYELSYQELDRWLRWKLFSKSQVARMLNVELMSELLLLLLNGLTAKTQTAINKAYHEFDDGLSQEKLLRARLEHVLETIDRAYLEIADDGKPDAFSQSPFSKQGWFYALFAWVHDLAYEGYLGEKPRSKLLPISLVRLRRHLESRALSLDEEDIDEDVLKALRGAATDKKSRQTRYKFVASGFSK